MNKELNLKIEDLFRWKGEFEITDSEGNVIETLYQRVIGDSDIQKARIEALKASKLLRRALRDRDSDEYLASMPLDDEFTEEQLIGLIVFSNYIVFRQQAELTVQERRIKEPKSDADLEEQEIYIENLEMAKNAYEDDINKNIAEQSKKLEEELKTKSYEELFKLFEKEQISLLAKYRMMEIFDEYCTFFGTFSDEKLKTRRFKTIEEFRDLSPRIKNSIIQNYKNLELNLSEVKK